MRQSSKDEGVVRRRLLAGLWSLITAGMLGTGVAGPSLAQGVDCARLQQQIAASGGRSRYGAAAQQQAAELARTTAYGHQLGCDRQQFLFFGGSSAPQCGPLNTRIAQMQANLAQLRSAGGGGRDDLVARFNASCRGPADGQPPPRQRGFFESLFGGGGEDRRAVAPADLPSVDPAQSDDGDAVDARGGSQAVCVRTCDGAFFPMNMSARRNQGSLSEMCTALCPNVPATVYTRNPNSEIKTAVGLDGTPYMDLPNALKFQKSFDAACTCHPAGKTWAEALAGAENALGAQRSSDIIVTPEKAAELSRPKLDPKARSSLLSASSAPTAKTTAESNTATDQTDTEVVGADGVKRRVRTVGPKL